MKRAAPVLALLLLAPWVGEFLLGNISVRQLPALLILALLYGCGALLIREVTRRTSRGWPTILLLGAAYGVIEAGIVDQSMFNPSFEGWDFQALTPLPGLGISAWYAWAFVIGHSVWSIAIPIALVELLFPDRGRTPWLGRVGLALTAVGYLAGCVVVWRYVYGSERFLASPGQLVGAAAVAVVLIAVAFACRPTAEPVRARLGASAAALGAWCVRRPERLPGAAGELGRVRVRDRLAGAACRTTVLVRSAAVVGTTTRARADRCGTWDVRLAWVRAHLLG